MNDTQHVIAPARDVSTDRIEIEIPNWNALESEQLTCLSCGARQHADGSIPCGH
ncbi:hypothetical protein [Paraburkholderia tropica]|uniref:hypothetical protein n=1 Tax=Paraburkholderia tropica TaxID=92647 RepID=UPI002AB12C59|nr:hypothetical protein [Paraburkholderia tropica]